ncbi:hypothetical protein [Kitasatospora aureofaciens]|uniref:hypothetical protein n=1 Tax=Kitasatospora aureofaciens TaxID=1894 RepID=UPI0036F4A2A5
MLCAVGLGGLSLYGEHAHALPGPVRQAVDGQAVDGPIVDGIRLALRRGSVALAVTAVLVAVLLGRARSA